jgi:hypothetical protein
MSVLLLLIGGVAAGAQGNSPPLPDSLFLRAQRLVAEGDAVTGRAILDSLVRVNRDGTSARAQALYWRAALAPDSTSAENDYIAIVVDHSLSPYAADALLRLAQFAYVRGNRSAAITHLQRLVLEHRTSAAAPEGWYSLGIARIADNDVPNGCAALDSAKHRIPASNVELLNRVMFVSQPCRALADARPAPPPATDSTATTERPAGRRWSAQVAAFRTSAEAERLVRALKDKGRTARVDTLKLYHVRVGSFASRTEAVTLVSQLKRDKIDAIVVEATRREP